MTVRLSMRTGTALVAVAASLSLVSTPAMAQSAGDPAQYCRSISGRVVCSSAAQRSNTPSSARAYEQWEDGSLARGSAHGYQPRASDPHYFPQSFGAYSNLRGFGQ